MVHPLVTIITVNFDHPEVTLDLLASLRLITYPNIEIIVVDNASPNDDPVILKQSYPEIIFIQSTDKPWICRRKQSWNQAGQRKICLIHQQ